MKKIALILLFSIAHNSNCYSQNTPYFPVFSPISPVSNQSNNQKNRISPIKEETKSNTYQKQSQIPEKNNHRSGSNLDEIKDIRDERKETGYKELNEQRLKLTMHYRLAYNQLVEMLGPDSVFSLIKAVHLVENAYFDEKLSFKKFSAMISKESSLCNEIIKQEKLNPNDNTVKNYAIQKLYSKDTKFSYKDLNTIKTFKPLEYDFEDFRADKDWTKMFVTKLLLTGKGQCHSMPLLYLMLAEQLNAKAYLVLAPEHCYIEFPVGHGNLYNFETTQGKLVTDNAIMMSGFISSTAVKNRLYMDTLGKKELIALCLVDLEQGYINKYGYDSLVISINNKILSIDPNNIQAMMMKADFKTYEFKYAVNKIGRPPVEKLSQYPDVYKLYQDMHQYYDQVDNLGYQAMPPEAYQKWLQSLNDIQHQREYEKLKDEIENKFKLSKSTEHTNLKNINR